MKKIIRVALLVLSFCLIVIGVYAQYTANLKEERRIKLEKERKELTKVINSHYNKYVKTNKETKLYKFVDNQYKEIGLIGKDIELTLNEIKIDYNTKYFCSIDGLCVDYSSVEKIEKLTEIVSKIQYKKYVPFNENIITVDKTIFYNDIGLEYQINEGMSLPIIIKDTDKYYVEYNNKLLYVKKSEIKEIKPNNNSNAKIKKGVRTFAYHVVYDPAKEKCDNVICHPISQFDSHMKYLSENNYLTLTMNDMELFMDKKIQIPEKSVVITLDDGQSYFNAVSIVEKYKVYATFFIVTGWFDMSKVNSQYMDFQSHTNNMHNNWKCSGGNQGGELLCADKNKILTDIKTSIEKLGEDTFALAYPFYDFNERAISILKEAGIRLGFIGVYGNGGISYQTTNKMMLERLTLYNTTTLEEFKSYL